MEENNEIIQGNVDWENKEKVEANPVHVDTENKMEENEKISRENVYLENKSGLYPVL